MNKRRQQLKYNNSLVGINRSALNHSTSKRLNTFNKAERFSAPQLPPYFLQKHQTQPNLQTTRTSRFPTIPKAERIFYFDKEKQLQPGPSPNAYHVKYSDQVWKIKHQGGTIGKRNLSEAKQSKPGPTDYQKPELLKKSFNRSFTFYRSQRDLGEYFRQQGKDSPGPKYEVNATFLAHKTKGKTAIFGSQKGRLNKPRKTIVIPKVHKRFDTSVLEKQLIATKESTKESKLKTLQPSSTTKCTFAHRKVERAKSSSPGPAAYAYFSQFSGWK